LYADSWLRTTASEVHNVALGLWVIVLLFNPERNHLSVFKSDLYSAAVLAPLLALAGSSERWRSLVHLPHRGEHHPVWSIRPGQNGP